MTYERSAPKYGLSVEMGTERVPNDGRFHVLVDGQIVLSTAVETLALAEFDEIKQARQSRGRSMLNAERVAEDVHAFRAENFAEKQSRDRGKGGRGVGRR